MPISKEKKMTDKTSKVAIVTGASRGIGAAVAERLAADGFTVVINYSGDTKSAEALARRIEGKGGRALIAKADVSEPQAMRGMFDTTEAAFGGVGVLVNNAGIMKLAKIADSDDALLDQRLGTPEDVASVVAFLVGPDGGWINGQVLRANGGMV
jgi:3-oxoacyl-[acyl-carrier protein] reductase